MSSVKDLLRGNVVDGSGTANYIPKWSDTDTISTSVIYDNGTNIGIGTSSPNAKLDVNGGIRVQGSLENLDAGAFTINASNAAGTIALRVAGATRANIVANGIQMPTGLGIDFGASSGTNSTSTLLDDYEEGTWIPVINGTISNPTVNYGTNNGIYTKIGNIITISFSVSWSSLSGGNGQMIINGLPFVCKNNTPDLSHMGSFQSWNIVIPGLFTVPAVANNTTFMYFNNMNSGAAFNDILISHLSTGFGFFRATLTYFTD